jgi:hypothetical protein
MERIRVVWHRDDDTTAPVDLEFTYARAADSVVADILDVITRDAVGGTVEGLGDVVFWLRSIGERA